MTPTDITALRQARGWTRGDLARFLGISESTVWRWERELTQPLEQYRRRMKRLARESARKEK